ncbi:hypothetical protein OL548_23585 [Lysinibacillus sp. MHQ-1]|nr:hypothetical protein OL548_23585 [Lysinibacillus sp. MHQ-1]
MGKEENMARNLFNLKTLLPLDIQMLADGGEGTPPTENPPSGDDINGQESTLTLKSVQTFLNENAEGKSYFFHRNWKKRFLNAIHLNWRKQNSYVI